MHTFGSCWPRQRSTETVSIFTCSKNKAAMKKMKFPPELDLPVDHDKVGWQISVGWFAVVSGVAPNSPKLMRCLQAEHH